MSTYMSIYIKIYVSAYVSIFWGTPIPPNVKFSTYSLCIERFIHRGEGPRGTRALCISLRILCTLRMIEAFVKTIYSS